MATLKEIPHLRTTTRKIVLEDQDQPVYFLMGMDFDSVSDMIFNTNNMINRSRKIKSIYIPGLYKGKIYNKIYKRNLKLDRVKEYRFMMTSGIRGIPNLPFEKAFFYGMHHHLTIFNELVEKQNTRIRVTVPLFWQYITNIFNTVNIADIPKKKVILFYVPNFKKFDKKVENNRTNPIYLLWYGLRYNFANISNINLDFYLYTDDKVLYFNPSKMKGTSDATVFLNQIKLLYKGVSTGIENINEESSKVEEVIELNKKITNNNTTKAEIVATSEIETITDEDTPIINENESVDDKELEEIANQIDDALREKVREVIREEGDTLDVREVLKKAKEKINADEKLIEEMYRKIQSSKMKTAPVLSKRDEQLKEEQVKINVKGTTIEEIEKIEPSKITIPTMDVSKQIFNTNEAAKKIKFANFDKEYIEKVLPRDIVNCFLALNNKSIPMFIRDISVEDTSNELNYKETWKVSLEDVNRKRHTLSVDIPKVLDNKFFWLGGNEKTILKQKYYYPVVKTKEDEVQIVTNYNKYFIFRTKYNLTSVEVLLKFIKNNSDSTDIMKYFTFSKGQNISSNHITTIEYDQLSSVLTSFQSSDCKIFFNQEDADKYVTEKKIKVPNLCLFIGYDKNGPLFINTDTQMTNDNRTICSIIVENLPEKLRKIHSKITYKPPKRNMGAMIRTMEQLIPVSILICFYEGFSDFLNISGIEYRLEQITTKKPELKPEEGILTFSNIHLIYKATPFANLLISGLYVVDLSQYSLEEMDGPEPYRPYLLKVYGSMSVLNSLMNAYEWTVDPITEEVLRDCNYPTTYSALLIYAVKLLLDNQYQPDMEQRLSRIRCMEVIPAILYWNLARNYTNFKNSAGRKPYTVPKDCVIKDLLALKTVEDTSVLNPVLELERTFSASQKGFRGVNLTEYYTMQKRAYSPSMIGVFGVSSSPDAQVGVTVSLTLEPSITNVRGYCDVKGDTERVEEYKNVNLLSPGELLIPMAGSHDDSTRLGLDSVSSVAETLINLSNCWNRLLGYWYQVSGKNPINRGNQQRSIYD